MSKEKIIKNQAKKLLEGNWLTIIAAVTAVCVTIILVQSISSMAMVCCDAIDFNTFEVRQSMKLPSLTISFAAAVLLFFLSPMLNGVYRIIGSVARNGSSNISDLFFYFVNKKYCKTLRLNLVLYIAFSFIVSIFNIYAYISVFADTVLKENSSFDIMINILLVLSWLVSAVAIAVIYFIFVHFPLVAYSFDDSRKARSYCFGMYAFIFRNLGATIKLTFSFIGWILLCFFVVPTFYVLPYLMTSLSVSSKWLFALDKDWGMLC